MAALNEVGILLIAIGRGWLVHMKGLYRHVFDYGSWMGMAMLTLTVFSISESVLTAAHRMKNRIAENYKMILGIQA